MSENRLRALVVDDESAMRTALARMLGIKGFDVETADSGIAALERVRPGRFDLVILDLWMPGLNGLQTLEGLRTYDPWVPVIAVSAMGTDATAEKCLGAGATGFLPKPFTASDIEQMVTEAKSGRREQESVASGLRAGWRGRILVADDHEAYRAAVSRRLRLDGFDVDEVGSGIEAAASAQAAEYDAMLLDIHMPAGDGLFAAASVRERDPHLPILFMSGEATEGEMREGLKTSVTGCLRKPVEMEKLGRILEFVIATGKRSRRHVEARQAFEALPPVKKAAVVLGARWRRIRRSPETRRVAIGIVIAVILAVIALRFMDAGHRALLEAERTFEGVPGPLDMYRTIVGYLERDERRELDQKDGRK